MVVREPARARLFKDACRLLFLAMVVGIPLSAALLPSLSALRGPAWLARLLMGLTAELLTLAVLRELLPPPRPGSHIVGMNGTYIRWLASSALVDVANLAIVRAPFWFLHTTRILYLRLLGAKINWRVGLHGDLVVREPALLSVGSGSQLEPGVIVEGALRGAGRIRISPVIVGQGCLVGAHSVLMPGATLGHEARIEPGAFIGEDAHVGVGATIGEGARIDKGVDLGSYASVGTGAILSEGVQVGDRARIAPGAVVEPRTLIGEREVWSGAPARRITP